MKKVFILFSCLMLGIQGLYAANRNTLLKLGTVATVVAGIEAVGYSTNPNNCLWWEIEKGDSPKKVREWIEKGANPNGKGKYRPMVLAAQKGRIESMKILREYGADIYSHNETEDALRASVRANQLETTVYLALLYKQKRPRYDRPFESDAYNLYKLAQDNERKINNHERGYVDGAIHRQAQDIVHYKDTNKKIQQFLFALAPTYIEKQEKFEQDVQELEESLMHHAITGEYTIPAAAYMMKEQLFPSLSNDPYNEVEREVRHPLHRVLSSLRSNL